MSDPQTRLSPAQVSEAGLTDWRQLMGRLHARFRTGDFTTGLELVARVGAAAEEMDHHPEIYLTYPEVLLTLSSHDVGGLTSRDVDLARKVSEIAADLGAEADVAGLTQVELGLDTARGGEHAAFYAALQGGTVEHGEVQDPSGQAVPMWWQEPGDPADDGALPPQDPEQRWHLDVWVPVDQAEQRLQAVLDAGGRLVSAEQAPSFWVVEDAEGNRSCICTVAERD